MERERVEKGYICTYHRPSIGTQGGNKFEELLRIGVRIDNKKIERNVISSTEVTVKRHSD